MVSEGLSHAVLPGLVLAFLLTRDFNSPLLIIAAAASGMVMVWLTQLVQRSGLVDDDAGLGIVFAGMFAVGILFVSANLRSAHFHADCIIDGNLALAALDRLEIGQYDFGPRPLIVMSVMLAIVLGFILLAYKEIKIGIFDPVLAKRFGLRPLMLQFVWLGIVSLTTVAAFDVAGSILIVALMIAPPAAAYLLTDRLGWLMALASAIAIIGASIGFGVANWIDIAPTGPIASMVGIVFLFVFAFAPRRGFLAIWLGRKRHRLRTVELLSLEFVAAGGRTGLDTLALPKRSIDKAITRLNATGMIDTVGDDLAITPAGQRHLQESLRS